MFNNILNVSRAVILLCFVIFIVVFFAVSFFQKFAIFDINGEKFYLFRKIVYENEFGKILVSYVSTDLNKKELNKLAVEYTDRKIKHLKRIFPEGLLKEILHNSEHYNIFVDEELYNNLFKGKGYTRVTSGFKFTIFGKRINEGFTISKHCIINSEYNINNEINFFRTDMHEMTEGLIYSYFREIKERESGKKIQRDPILRWINDGIATYASTEFLRSIIMENIISDKIEEEIKKGKHMYISEGKDVSFLDWSYLIHYTDKSFPYDISEALNNNYRNYSDARWFFMQLVKRDGEEIIRDLIQYIYDNTGKLKSEDVLLWIEKRIGKEELELLVGKDYIKRVKEYRVKLFDDVFNYMKKNGLTEHYAELQERYFIPREIIQKYIK